MSSFPGPGCCPPTGEEPPPTPPGGPSALPPACLPLPRGGSSGVPREGNPSKPRPLPLRPRGSGKALRAAPRRAARPLGPTRSRSRRPQQRRLGLEPAGGARPGRRRLRPPLPHGRGRHCRREEKLPLLHPPPSSAPPTSPLRLPPLGILQRGSGLRSAAASPSAFPVRGAAGARAEGSSPAGQPPSALPVALSYPQGGGKAGRERGGKVYVCVREGGSGGGGLGADERCSLRDAARPAPCRRGVAASASAGSLPSQRGCCCRWTPPSPDMELLLLPPPLE